MIVRYTSTCFATFDGLNLFVDVFAVVDFGSSPITSTAAWTLVMLAIVQIVVPYPDPQLI